MGQTLFQRFVYGREIVENNYFNPAKAKIGNSFSVDAIDMIGCIFSLREIWEYKRSMNGIDMTFGDYILLSRPIGKDDVWLRVRFMPTGDDETPYKVLILTKYDEMPFCKELDEACRCGSGEFIITNNDTGEQETFWRLLMNGSTSKRVLESYDAAISIVKDVNGDGIVESSEVQKKEVEYWDYSRDTKNEAGHVCREYLFIEYDKEYRTQTMWRGTEIDPQNVTVL
jgi:hypothetical protein